MTITKFTYTQKIPYFEKGLRTSFHFFNNAKRYLDPLHITISIRKQPLPDVLQNKCS